MVKCFKTCASDSFVFLKGKRYKVLEEYIGAIAIQDEYGKRVVFDTPDIFGSNDDYTQWFTII